jgi:hypothetical protein
MIRKPAVAGQFYSSNPSDLSDEVRGYFEESVDKQKAIGVISPHAGLMYSGRVAGAVFSRIEPPGTFIILSPNHTGLGSNVAIMSHGEWEVPTGELKIDERISAELLKQCSLVEDNSLAHQMEHSIEVQLPFIIQLSPESRIVPVTMITGSLESCRVLGESLADVISAAGYDVTIVASSDMTHYEEDSVARSLDRMAIDRVLSLDPEGLFNVVKNNSISMCGFGPATAMLFAANKLGAQRAELVKYMTSGDASGDYGHVVGYAGMIIN